ncbi:MAG: methyltransferase domain-containing protein [Candidatus Electrothrix sp. YB6]
MQETSQQEINKKITEYYRALTPAYEKYSVQSNNIHYGYWEKTARTKSHREALEHMNAFVAKAAQVQAGDRVLDAGCGMGGSSVWLAKIFGCRVTGITLCSEHIPLAERFAREHKVEHLVQFFCRDFADTGFESASFDLVWVLESCCYAADKRDFIAESARLLQSGGRLIVADGFLQKTALSAEEQKMLDCWMHGWAVPNVISPDQFGRHLEDCGFEHITFSDITKNIMMTSLWMHRFAKLIYPAARIMVKLGFWPEQKKGHWQAALKQFHLFADHIGCYGLFQARKIG